MDWNELWNTLINFAVSVGGKILGALLVLIIGRIVIKLVMKMIRKSKFIEPSRCTECQLAGFCSSCMGKQRRLLDSELRSS